MRGCTETLTALCAVLLATGSTLAAQDITREFTYDELRPTAIQVDLGLLGASRLVGTPVGGARLDFGRIAPRVRLLLGLSYYRSEFDRDTRARFERRLEQIVIDPAGDDTIRVGRIFWADLVADIDLQYVIPQGPHVTTYIGMGGGIHARNGSGTAIDGTFVEDALDQVVAGLNVTLGAELAVGPEWRWTLDARGVLLSDLATVSLRAGLMYRFGRGDGP